MATLGVDARNYFLACYAVSLIQGETLRGKSIRSRTVINYLTAAYALFAARKLFYLPLLGTDYIHLIVTTLKNYEEVPRRRNMISDDMMWWMLRKSSTHSPDSAFVAILDWTILGRYTGARQSEWCQVSSTKYKRIEVWPNTPPEAFILSDFVFLDTNKRHITITIHTDPRDASYVRIKWRKQKNGDNGEEIDFGRHTHRKFCPVLAAVRIVQRSLRLHTPRDEPIAVFTNNARQRRFITAKGVATQFQTAAHHAHNIAKSDKHLQQWTTHSIRVTAANLLHRERFADSFIQKRLRWKSRSFLMYLRNTIYAADEHASLKLSPENLPPPEDRVYRNNEPHDIMFQKVVPQHHLV